MRASTTSQSLMLALVGLLGCSTLACSSDDSSGGPGSSVGTSSIGSTASGSTNSTGTGSTVGTQSTTQGTTTSSAAGSTTTSAGATAAGGSTGTTTGGGNGTGGPVDDSISFFVTSYDAMVEQSGSQYGFGGDLGGLSGADAICQSIGESVGAGDKTWRAFLSATDDGSGSPVHAIDRIGNGPWYDANRRMIAASPAELTSGNRPTGDAAASDLPDEYGRSLEDLVQGHDVLTGSNNEGKLHVDPDEGALPAHTCNDWTSADVDTVGEDYALSFPMAGHAWPSPANSGWIQSHGVWGCAPGYQFGDSAIAAPDTASGRRCVGCAGGYGGIYCFALRD